MFYNEHYNVFHKTPKKQIMFYKEHATIYLEKEYTKKH